MERVLITGAGGFLGSHLINESPLQTDVFGLTHTSMVNLKGDQWFRTSITEREHLFKTLDRINPTGIIHAAAISSEGASRKDVQYAHDVNVNSCGLLAEWCTANDVYLLFTSTDLVFSGNEAPYTENDATGSKMLYGQLKAEAEELIASYGKSLIVRLPLLYGIGLSDRKGILHQFIQKTYEGQEQGLFTDEYRTPVCVSDVAAFMWQLMERKFTGLLHLGGKQRVSRFELGELFAEKLHLPNVALKKIRRSDIKMEYRPEDTSLDSEKAWSMGFEPGNIEDRLAEIYSTDFSSSR